MLRLIIELERMNTTENLRYTTYRVRHITSVSLFKRETNWAIWLVAVSPMGYDLA